MSGGFASLVGTIKAVPRLIPINEVYECKFWLIGIVDGRHHHEICICEGAPVLVFIVAREGEPCVLRGSDRDTLTFPVPCDSPEAGFARARYPLDSPPCVIQGIDTGLEQQLAQG